MRKIPKKLSFYDSTYHNSFPTEQYFVLLFDAIPSKFITKKFYSNLVIDYFKSIGFIEEANSTITKRVMEVTSESLFVDKNKEMMIVLEIDISKLTDLVTFDIYFNIQKGQLSEQLDLKEIEKFYKTAKKYNIHLVKNDMGYLDTEEYDLFIPELNLELNYGENFLKIHNVIINRLNQKHGKGIVLLHGEPGTGKTTYSKFLTKEIINKNVLFIPPALAESLSDPQIIPFLMENKNSILLIEDAERIIATREGRSSSAGVSTLLNLTDGILGDCLNIQVVATFNMSKERIDPAILRKGRLICEHKFDKLSITDTNKLLNSLKKNMKSDIPLTLADIYNVDVDDIRVTKKDMKIGFIQ